MHRDAIGFVERGTVSLEQRSADCAEAFGWNPDKPWWELTFLQIGNSDTPFDSVGDNCLMSDVSSRLVFPFSVKSHGLHADGLGEVSATC